MAEVFYTYVLKSENKDYFYKGMTNNLERRLAEHNAGRCTSSKPHRPFSILYFETFYTQMEAREREVFFKSTKGRRFIAKIIEANK